MESSSHGETNTLPWVSVVQVMALVAWALYRRWWGKQGAKPSPKAAKYTQVTGQVH
jgi:hypothetical protein